MAIGQPPNLIGINQTLTGLAINLRNEANTILAQQAYLTGLGLAGLQGLGFTATDAQAVLDAINHMATVMGVYKGTVQQGGTGGTGASLFNFENSLTPLWGGG